MPSSGGRHDLENGGGISFKTIGLIKQLQYIKSDNYKFIHTRYHPVAATELTVIQQAQSHLVCKISPLVKTDELESDELSSDEESIVSVHLGRK